MGPINPTSFAGNNRWIVVFVDDFSRYAKVYCITNKSESGDCLEKYLRETRNLRGKNEKLCFLRSDNGTEFTGGKFSEIIDQEKATFDFAPPHTPQLNGTAERFNKTIQNKIRALMFDSCLPESMWSLAADAATYIYNRTPHKSNGFKTPLSFMNKNIKSNVDKIKRFGCLAYAKILTNTKKFGERAARGILVGYRLNSTLLLQPSNNRFLISRHVRYNGKVTYRDIKEHQEIQKTANAEKAQESDLNTEKNDEYIEKNEEYTNKHNAYEEKNEEKTEENIEENNQKGISTPEVIPFIKPSAVKRKLDPPTRVLPKRAAKTNPRKDPNFIYQTSVKPVEDSQEYTTYRSIAEIYRDPVTFKQAMKSRESQSWQAAIDEELKSMTENNIWTLVDRPLQENIIDSRLVVRGFKDTNDYELRETYAPVSRMTVIRSVLAIINKYDLEALQLDVKTAFLNGTLENDILQGNCLKSHSGALRRSTLGGALMLFVPFDAW
ncbi:hypothetical protein TKK_0013894 [Trichogramma kaykai]